VTGFGSVDNSTCKRVLNLLEPGGLRLGQVAIKRVAVVELGAGAGMYALGEMRHFATRRDATVPPPAGARRRIKATTT